MKGRQAESSGGDLGIAKGSPHCGKNVPKMSKNVLVGQSRQVGVHRDWHAAPPRDGTFESRVPWQSGSR